MKFKIKKWQNALFLMVALTVFGQCQRNNEKSADQTNVNQNNNYSNDMEVTKMLYGTIESGDQINLFRMKNKNGVVIEIIEYGAIVAAIKVPDKNGQIDDITLGYNDIEGWENDPYYFGATIGRVANRTGGARFVLEGKTYDLAPNTLPDFGKNHLHGGVKGFNKVLWKGKSYANDSEVGVILKYQSKDGEEGYPGNLDCQVKYSLNDKNELKIDYSATTDKTTLVNFTHHSYFNLKGEGQGTVLDQEILINADNYTPATDDLIPTGEIAEVKDLPIDFTLSRTIRSQIDQMQMAKFKGYDLNYVLNHSPGALGLAAKAFDPFSGRILEVFTTQACMHFYTSNFLEGKPGKDGNKYEQYGAFCFEPQGYPDAANKPQFSSIVLEPGTGYNQTIIYKFSVQN